MIRTEKFSTGLAEFDDFLNGGYEKGIITTIYGPGGSGKTNLSLLAIIPMITKDKKVLFVDTESNYSPERFSQIFSDTSKYDNIIISKAHTFAEQDEIIANIKEMKDIGLIIVDSIGALYRLEMGKKKEISELNRMLGVQLSHLSYLARKDNIPVLITNQVYSSFDDRDSVQLVGGDILKYGSKCLIELKKAKNGARIAIVKKHRSIPEGIEFAFKIINNGIEKI